MKVREIQKVADAAATKALKNVEFKKELLEDANKAIKKDFNKDLETELTFHEFSDKHLVFVLPTEGQEIDDDVLENVSGGVIQKGRGSFNPAMVSGYAVYPVYNKTPFVDKLF